MSSPLSANCQSIVVTISLPVLIVLGQGHIYLCAQTYKCCVHVVDDVLWGLVTDHRGCSLMFLEL